MNPNLSVILFSIAAPLQLITLLFIAVKTVSYYRENYRDRHPRFSSSYANIFALSSIVLLGIGCVAAVVSVVLAYAKSQTETREIAIMAATVENLYLAAIFLVVSFITSVMKGFTKRESSHPEGVIDIASVWPGEYPINERVAQKIRWHFSWDIKALFGIWIWHFLLFLILTMATSKA